MMTLEYYFLAFLLLQVLHSIEESAMGFYKAFPLVQMRLRTFLLFEVVFISFWFFVFLFRPSDMKEILMHSFTLLMFANGLWHLVWFGFFKKFKKYVPGLVTAFFHVFLFLIFYFSQVVL